MKFDQDSSPSDDSPYKETHVPYLPLPSDSPQQPVLQPSPAPVADLQAADTPPFSLSEGTTTTQESNESNQQQPQQKHLVRSILLLAPAGISSLFGLLCLSVPLWGRSFILAPPQNDIGGFTGIELDPTCVNAVTYTLPILICLMCLALVALNVIGFIRGRAMFFGNAGCVSAFLAVFALSTPFWGWAFVWGDGVEGTGCENLLGGWFTLVGFLVGLALVILNLVALTFLRRKSRESHWIY